jgi:hypothetical protein
MQTQNPFLDEFAKLTTAAMGIAQAAGEPTYLPPARVNHVS